MPNSPAWRMTLLPLGRRELNSVGDAIQDPLGWNSMGIAAGNDASVRRAFRQVRGRTRDPRLRRRFVSTGVTSFMASLRSSSCPSSGRSRFGRFTGVQDAFVGKVLKHIDDILEDEVGGGLVVIGQDRLRCRRRSATPSHFCRTATAISSGLKTRSGARSIQRPRPASWRILTKRGMLGRQSPVIIDAFAFGVLADTSCA